MKLITIILKQKTTPQWFVKSKKVKILLSQKTFSKVYGLAELRIGYLVNKPEVAINLRKNIMAFTNVLAIKAAKNAIDDQEFYNFSLKKTVEVKK